jgi:glycosyltransferase involved in cell wall biosynthesis
VDEFLAGISDRIINMHISVVIPTCNRKQRLLSSLRSLQYSSYPLLEVIIVDSGEDRLLSADYAIFKNLDIKYIDSEKSVCIQRNEGIRRAAGEWIFLCDDDMKVPSDYIQKLSEHAIAHPEAGAISGRVLQQEANAWTATYPVTSAFQLLWKFIFQLSIWGEINCRDTNIITKKITAWYKRKGNYISKAGWPVLTDFSGDFSLVPLYTLGASLVKRDWLLNAPYDEVLDRYGIGDNYGVAMDFPSPVHLLNSACVYHYQEPANRLKGSLQYFRRILALDYFMQTKEKLHHAKRWWLLWSLTGNLLSFLITGDRDKIHASLRCIRIVAFGKNPYYQAAKNKQRVTEPQLYKQ